MKEKNLEALMLNVCKKITLDYVHPIGQVFITTSSKFDPNKEWGGYGLR